MKFPIWIIENHSLAGKRFSMHNLQSPRKCSHRSNLKLSRKLQFIDSWEGWSENGKWLKLRSHLVSRNIYHSTPGSIAWLTPSYVTLWCFVVTMGGYNYWFLLTRALDSTLDHSPAALFLKAPRKFLWLTFDEWQIVKCRNSSSSSTLNTCTTQCFEPEINSSPRVMVVTWFVLRRMGVTSTRLGRFSISTSASK